MNKFKKFLEESLNKQNKNKLHKLFSELLKEYKDAKTMHNQITLRLKNPMLRWNNDEIDYLWSLYKDHKFE